MSIKPQVDFETFLSLDIRAGKILKVEDSLATKPTYRFTVDFGPEIGEKVTVAAMTHYSKEELVGLTILGLVNVGSPQNGARKNQNFCSWAFPMKKGTQFRLQPIKI